MRLRPVSLVDGRNVPLSRKLLARPGAIRRIRILLGSRVRDDPAVLYYRHEVGSAESLGIPIYGSDPELTG